MQLWVIETRDRHYPIPPNEEPRVVVTKFSAERPYADPEAATRKLLQLAALVGPINGRIHIEKINAPFLFKAGCNASAAEFGAGLEYAIEQGWIELHESGTHVRIKTPDEVPLAP